ncbi:DUF4192 domain-containing protein [Flexivirga meconopsidis]|uniref:DUF4192 domain-containing protein n=1 Tax=Flexivirga meconopsidis TaxID=2977121 RepID=UPI00223FB1A6|nr:DUF4192 domain-containing protein [Flexivirga meconopsidis]
MTSTLHGVGDIVAYLPYEFGFIPHDSIVMIGLHGGSIQFTARIDTPPADESFAAAAHLLQPVDRTPIDDVLLVLYDDACRSGDALVTAARHRLDRRDIVLSHVVHVSASGWRAVACRCGHCPRHWTAPSADTDVGPIADRVLCGVAPVADRATLAGELDQRHPLVAMAVSAELDKLDLMCVGDGRPAVATPEATEALATVLVDQSRPVARVPVTMLAVATDLMSEVLVRDAVLAWLMPDFLDQQRVPLWPSLQARLGPPPTRSEDGIFGDRAPMIAGRLKEWVQCLPPQDAVPVLLLVAGLHWTMGAGAVATMALQRALAIEPECNLAQLLDAAVQRGLRPSRREDRRPA